MQIREDRWLSSIFNHSVFKIDIGSPAVADDCADANICQTVRRHSSAQPAPFYYAKVDTARIGIVRQLSLAGLYVVDVNVTFGLNPRSAETPATTAGLSIQE